MKSLNDASMKKTSGGMSKEQQPRMQKLLGNVAQRGYDKCNEQYKEKIDLLKNKDGPTTFGKIFADCTCGVWYNIGIEVVSY